MRHAGQHWLHMCILCGFTVITVAVAVGCGDGGDADRRVKIDDSMTLEEAIDAGASILWVAAHPDDETVPGALLVRACAGLGNPCLLLVLTPGDGGTCYAPPCLPDLVTVRRTEMEEAARRYGAKLEIHEFTNMPGSTTPVDEIRALWESEGEPIGVIVEALRRFRPNVVLSFDPSRGFTGHTEHMVAAMLTDEAVPLAADSAFRGTGGQPFRADRLYHVLNRYLFMLPFVGMDDGPVDETFHFHVPCPRTDKTCFEAGLAAAEAHHSQWPFVAGMALGGPIAKEGYLKRVGF